MAAPYIDWHLRTYPAMTAQDMVKLVFQAHCGCGHLLAEEGSVLAYIEREESTLTPDAAEPLTEPLGERYCRLNLRRAMAEGIQPLWIARMMRLSPISNDRDAAYRELAALPKTALPRAELLTLARRLMEEPDWLPGHSEPYRQAYAPAYRVIGRTWERLLPVLCAVGRKMQESPQVLLCIDGPCGSGKSTMAQQLVQLTDAACIPMDDFYTPHPQKTPERLAQPGGNADIERLLEEFLMPWSQQGHGGYRPYLCAEDCFGQPIEVPARPLTILEGSYSLHPKIAALADVRLFLTIDEEEQLRRLRAREGEEGLQRFREKWIPLERAYHAAFALPDDRCLIVENQLFTDV